MKNVLFVIGNAEIGGTRTSLFNLLNHLSNTKDINVHLYMISQHGALMERIPNGITLVPENWRVNASLPGQPNPSINQVIFHVAVKVIRIFIGYEKVYGWLFKKAALQLFDKYGEFDAVFGFQEGVCNYFSEFIRARKHYTWIHNDIEAWYSPKEFEYSAYKKSDKVLFVADAARCKFCAKFSELTEKCEVVKNTINSDAIKTQAKEKQNQIVRAAGRIYISVGRVTKQKAFDRIVEVAKKLKEKECEFKWFILGDGPEKENVQKLIEQNSLEETVIMLGATENPYKYMSAADALVVTSVYESQPMVILEALTLGIPVITTRYSSAEEILKDTPYGIICENSEKAIADTILGVSDTELENMRLAAHCYEYDNEAIVNRIRGLVP